MIVTPGQSGWSTPLGDWWRKHENQLQAGFPWLVGGAITLLLAGAKSPGAFNLTLGIEGVLLAVWAGFMALRATEDARQIHMSVEDARGAVHEIQGVLPGLVELSVELDVALGSVTRMLSQADARDDLDRLLPVQDAVTPLMMKGWQLYPKVGDPRPAIRLSAPERREAYLALKAPLDRTDALELPNCRRLLHRVGPIRALAQVYAPPGPDLDNEDFRELIEEARAEVRRHVVACRYILRPR